MCINKQRLEINEKTKKLFQTKEKTPETGLNKSDLPDKVIRDFSNKEFKVMVIKIFTNIRLTMWKQSMNVNKETFLFDKSIKQKPQS